MRFGNPRACLRGGRRFTLAALAVASAAFCSGAGAQAPINQGNSAQGSAKGRILVQARAGLSDKALAKILGDNGGGRGRRMGRSDLHIIDLPEGSEQAMVARLSRNPHVKFAEIDRLVPHDLVTNDPYLGSQWHLATIKAAAAWDLSQGSGITIAILDSGVLPTHPDLVQVPGWNFFDNNANTADANGHGTAVAGAAAAMANNGAGVSGVAGSARIMPLRVSDAAGYAYYSTIASAVTFAADNGARVANASFSGVYASASVQSAANYFRSKGGLLVVSAGNSGANDGAAATSAMIPVSATDSSDLRASWSSFGSYVALSAPGVGIWTTSSDGGYRAASGTSFSAPITAGVAALVMAAKPSLSSAQVEQLLYTTAQDLGSAGRDIYFGHGRVDANAAVIAAAGTVAVDTQAPAVAIAAPLGSASVTGLTTVDVSASDNVGVTKVVLQVNGSNVATDTASPFQFSWDTSAFANGAAKLVAVAYDAAGNSKASASISVNVANNVVVSPPPPPPPPVTVDTTPPVVAVINPANGKKVSGKVRVSTSASDNAGASGIKQTLYIDGKMVASGSGSSLSFDWNTRKVSSGAHTIQAVAQDAAGNKTTASVQVRK